MSPLSSEELRRLDAWWRAANYLSVGQIYMLDNALLREPLTLEHVKPRLIGHWGTTLGHGGPGLVASTWAELRSLLEGYGNPAEGNWRSHQVPLAKLAENPEHLTQREHGEDPEDVRDWRLPGN